MGTVITHGGDTIAPTLVLGYAAERASGNIVHTILGRSNPDITLRPALLRSGTLELLFEDEADAIGAVAILANADVCAVVSDERASVVMSFVVVDRIGHALDDETRDMWVVRAPFQEVSP